MPFRYQCFECDQWLFSEQQQVICPACRQASLEQVTIPEDIDPGFMTDRCRHCLSAIQDEYAVEHGNICWLCRRGSEIDSQSSIDWRAVVSE